MPSLRRSSRSWNLRTVNRYCRNPQARNVEDFFAPRKGAIAFCIPEIPRVGFLRHPKNAADWMAETTLWLSTLSHCTT